jgi:periplasmic protein TonB
MGLRVLLGLILLLGVSAAVPRKASPQEASAAAPKRKVRYKVAPYYPPLAKQMNLTGQVKIVATVTADGRVSNTSVIGGSPLLVSASMDALKQWRFEPAAKETTEIVQFDFNGK